MLRKIPKTGKPEILFADYDGLARLAKRNSVNGEVFLENRKRKNLKQQFLYAGNKRLYFLILDRQKKIVASASLMPRTYAENTMGLSQVCVDPAHRHKGYATALVKQVFGYVAAKNTGGHVEALSLSGYEPDGKKYLKPVIERLQAQCKFPVLS